MFRANPEHTGVYDNGGIEPGNTELWRFATGGIIYSSPSVANGIVYVGSDDKNLYAIDAMTGKEKWRFAMGGWVYSAPAVVNGIVYAGNAYESLYDLKGANGSLHAIDAVTGKEKWRFVTGSYVDQSPAVANGIVYIGSGDKNLYAIDAVTGEEKWRFATGDRVVSSPAVAKGIIYVGSNDKNLYAIGAIPVSPTTVPPTIPSTHITLPRTTIQQTIASIPTTSPVSGQNSDPTVALPVLAIIVTILILAGGGYMLDRVKNKP